DVARAYRIDGDVARRVFERERAGEADYGVLGGRVGGDVGRAAQPRDAGAIEDAPEAAREHVRDRLPGAQVGPGEVHRQQAVPERLVGVGEFGAGRLTGVVDEYLDGTEALARAGEGVADGLR